MGTTPRPYLRHVVGCRGFVVCAVCGSYNVGVRAPPWAAEISVRRQRGGVPVGCRCTRPHRQRAGVTGACDPTLRRASVLSVEVLSQELPFVPPRRIDAPSQCSFATKRKYVMARILDARHESCIK